MVQNGQFAACAAAVSVSALNSVDLPTLGNPTIPHLNPISSSTFSRRHGLSRPSTSCFIQCFKKDVDARHKATAVRFRFSICRGTSVVDLGRSEAADGPGY